MEIKTSMEIKEWMYDKLISTEKAEKKWVAVDDLKELEDINCPAAYGFEGPETFTDCRNCIVCRLKQLFTSNSKVKEVNKDEIY